MAGILVHIVRFIYIAVADKHTSHLELSCYLLLLCVRSQVKLSHLFILVFNFSIACIWYVQNAEIQSVVNGPITYSPDVLPLLGPTVQADNLWMAVGFG